MSIIYEALKKIEEEKKDEPSGRSPIVFTFPGEEASRVEHAGAGAFRHAARYAALGIPLLFFLLLFIRPDLFRTSSAHAPSPAARGIAAPSAMPIIKEVRLQPRDILPSTVDLSLKPQEPVAPVALKSFTSIKDTKIPELRLKGISQSGSRSWAFINDRMLKVGDIIDGAEIVDILKDRVKLKYTGVEFTLGY